MVNKLSINLTSTIWRSTYLSIDNDMCTNHQPHQVWTIWEVFKNPLSSPVDSWYLRRLFFDHNQWTVNHYIPVSRVLNDHLENQIWGSSTWQFVLPRKNWWKKTPRLNGRESLGLEERQNVLRRFSDKNRQAWNMGQILGFCHRCWRNKLLGGIPTIVVNILLIMVNIYMVIIWLMMVIINQY